MTRQWLRLLPLAAFFAGLSSSVHAAVTPLNFTVNMSEAVNVTTTGGTPYIDIDVGGVARQAAYAGGSGTAALTFSYTPQAGDLDLDGIAVQSPVQLSGGAIADLNGNPQTSLVFTPPTTTGVKVDYPSLSMDFINNSYTLSGTSYNSFSSFLTAAGGSYTRSGTATYFDATGTMQTATANTPRFDHDPITLAAKGLLVEGTGTNYVRNSMMQGAVAGTPGTRPTNWSYTSPVGVSRQIVGTGTINGLTYIDVRFFGTSTSSSGDGVFDPEAATFIAATSGQVWTASVWMAKAPSSGNVGRAPTFSIRERDSGGSNLAATTVAPTLTSSLQRVVATRTLNNASTVYVQPTIRINVPLNESVDYTLRIAAPQIEQKGVATSFIPTTNAAATRNADAFTIPTGSWYNQAAGSAYGNVAYVSSTGTGYPMFWRFDDGTGNNRWNMFYQMSTNQVGFDGLTGNVAQQSARFSATASATVKIGAAVTTGNIRSVMNGTLSSASTNWTQPTVTRFEGGLVDNTSYKWIQQFKYYPARISDANLQLLAQ